MATLYVENIPDDIYKALRKRAKANRKSIAAEVIGLLQQYVPSEAEIRRRRKIFEELAELRARPPIGTGPFPSAEELVREDRER